MFCAEHNVVVKRCKGVGHDSLCFVVLLPMQLIRFPRSRARKKQLRPCVKTDGAGVATRRTKTHIRGFPWAEATRLPSTDRSAVPVTHARGPGYVTKNLTERGCPRRSAPDTRRSNPRQIHRHRA